MPNIPLQVEAPATWAYEDGQTYYNERLAFEILYHANMMSNAGYEITFDTPDEYDYTVLWNRQNSTITGLIDALNAQETADHIENYYSVLANELNELLLLPVGRENYLLRSAAIGAASMALSIGQPMEFNTDEIEQHLDDINDTLQELIPEEPEEPEEPTEPEEPEEFGPWAAQSAVIAEQSSYMGSVSASFNARKAELPEDDSAWLSSFLWEVGEWISGKIATVLWGPVVGELVEIGVALTGIVIGELKKAYTEGSKLCTAMIAENDAILTLDPTRENYMLRSAIITQHDHSTSNLLRDIANMEDVIVNSNIQRNTWLEHIENTLSGRREDDEDEELQDFWTDVGEALTDIMPTPDDSGNLPALPEHPVRLPNLPDSHKSSLMAKFYYTLLKMEAEKIQQLQRINEGLDGLQFQSIEVEMGDRRMSYHGKIVDVQDIL